MRALVVCDNHGPFPAALTERRPPGLMPLGRATVLGHILESLARGGVKRVTLVAGEHAAFVQGTFGDGGGTGGRWGLAIDYLLARGFEGVAEAVRLAEPAQEEDLLVVPSLTIFEGSPWLEHDAAGGPVVLRWGSGPSPGPELLLMKGAHARSLAPGAATALMAIGVSGLSSIGVSGVDDAGASGGDDAFAGGRIARASGAAVLVRDLESYWQANRMLLEGEAPFGPPPSRPGPRSSVHPRARVERPALLGEAVEVGAACQVGPLAVIGDNCILDDGAEARECVIFPGTFVGRNASVVRAVADQGLLVSLDGEAALHVPDPFILGPASALSFSSLAWEAAQRAIALAALAAALPVLAWWFLRGLWDERAWTVRKVVASRGICSLSGAKRFVESDMRLAGSPSPLVAHLPALWEVFRGRLALVGVEPLEPERAAEWAGGWAEPRFSCLAGLVNPWHAEPGGDPDDAERRVMEVYYSQTRTAASDARLLWKAASLRARALLAGLKARSA